MSGKRLVAGTVVVGLLALWWIMGRQPAPEAPAAPVPSAPAVQPSTVTVPANSTSPAATPPSSNTQQPSTNDPGGVMSAAEQQQVAAFATRFMTAFAQPTGRVSARAWWERVARMLTDDAVDTYAGITPDQVGFRKVTGTPGLQQAEAGSDAFWIQPVIVPTDGGRYTLLIQLPSSGFSTRYLVIEIQEP